MVSLAEIYTAAIEAIMGEDVDYTTVEYIHIDFLMDYLLMWD